MTPHFALGAKSANDLAGGAKSETTRRQCLFGTFCRFCRYSLGEGTRVCFEPGAAPGTARSTVPPSREKVQNPQNPPNPPAVQRFEFGTWRKPVPNGAKLLPNWGCFV